MCLSSPVWLRKQQFPVSLSPIPPRRNPLKALWLPPVPAPRTKEGDTVLYGKYAGTEVKLDDETYLIMRQGDILAIMD